MERTGSDWRTAFSVTGFLARLGYVSHGQYIKAVSNGKNEVLKSSILLGFGT
jgi:hypothetical protein